MMVWWEALARATLAQLAERVTCNLEAVGSNPTGGYRLAVPVPWARGAG